MKIVFTRGTAGAVIDLFSSLLSQPLSADQLYKWVDRHGKVTYQSEPPPADAWSVEQKKIGTGVKAEAPEENTTVTVPITFYVKPDCPLCDKARAYFGEKQIAITEVDITTNPDEAEKMLKQVGHDDVPTVIVGNKAITGFQEEMLSKILVSSGYRLPAAEGAEEGTEEAAPGVAEGAAEQPAETTGEETGTGFEQQQ